MKHMPLSAFEAPIELKSGEGFSDDTANDVVTKALADLTATVDERLKEVEAKSADAAKIGERLEKVEARLNRPGIIGRAVDTKEDAGAVEKKAFVDYIRTGVIDRKALSIASNGGTLVPDVLANEIIKNLVQLSPVRSIARVSSIGTGKITIPTRMAGPTGAWVTEVAGRSETSSTYSSVDVEAFEYACYTDVSLQVLEDAQFDLASEIIRDLSEEFARAEGAAFVSGDGSGKPTGFLHSPAVGSVVDSSVANAGFPTADELIKTLYSLPTPYANNATWVMSRSVMAKIRQMKSATSGEYIWAAMDGDNSLAYGHAGTILGRPVVELPDMPAFVGTPATDELKYIAAVGDFSSAYRIVDRIGLDFLRDDFTVRANGKVRFHARRRVGGETVNSEAIRFLKLTAQ